MSKDIYDLIIHINSMKVLLNEGWYIDSSSRGLENYNNRKNDDSILISILGNLHSGKSFILTKISEINFYSMEAFGIKYPNIKEKPFIYIYNSGMNSALVKDEYYQLNHEKEYYKAIIYYISGMTDNYAIDTYNKIIRF